MDGIRSSKTVDGVTYNYITQDGLVVQQSWNGNVMDFIYDENGRPYACIYKNAIYYYVLNLQGDVIGLVNTSGAYVAKYAYDAWGNVISSSGTMADINPIRYRGYYYDTETKLYYLGSRYYDPAVKRFINADNATLITSNTTALTDKNLFAYCDNNPVSRSDDGGEFWASVVASAVLGGVTSAIDAVIAGENTTGIIRSAAKGAVSGAVGGVIGGVLSAAKAPVIIKTVVSAARSAAKNIYTQKKADKSAKIDWYSVTTSVGCSLLSSSVSAINSRVVSSATKDMSKTSARVVKYITSTVKNTATYTYNLAFKTIRNGLRRQTA